MTDVITNLDKLRCAERELSLRKLVYPARIGYGKMSAGKSAHEIACMQAIVDDYRRILDEEQ